MVADLARSDFGGPTQARNLCPFRSISFFAVFKFRYRAFAANLALPCWCTGRAPTFRTALRGAEASQSFLLVESRWREVVLRTEIRTAQSWVAFLPSPAHLSKTDPLNQHTDPTRITASPQRHGALAATVPSVDLHGFGFLHCVAAFKPRSTPRSCRGQWDKGCGNHIRRAETH